MCNCACSSLMRFSTRSSAFLPATGRPAIGEVVLAGGGGVVTCVAEGCADCASAAPGSASRAAKVAAARWFESIFIGVVPSKGLSFNSRSRSKRAAAARNNREALLRNKRGVADKRRPTLLQRRDRGQQGRR